MPTIEITREQADALARGENVTLSPPEARYIVVTINGNAYDVKAKATLPTGYFPGGLGEDVHGSATLRIAGPRKAGREGQVQTTITGFVICFVRRVPE